MDNKHNNAINDDALENVSGGLYLYGPSSDKTNLTPNQIKKLEAYGITAGKAPDDRETPYHYVFRTSSGKEVSDTILSELLK